MVIGNCMYDSTSNTYYANEGDSLLLFYTGTWSGGDYVEFHYYNDSLIGSRLDTVTVTSSGTYKVELGCFGIEHTFTSTIVFASPSGVPPSLSNTLSFNPRISQFSNRIELFIESNTTETFKVEIVGEAGEQTHYLLLDANTHSSFSNLSRGLKLIRITNENGHYMVRKIVVP